MSTESKKSNMPIPFDEKLLPPPCGFTNIGATCYWNAFLQCMITCSSFIQIILKNADQENYKANPVAQLFAKLFREFNVKYREVSASKGSPDGIREREEAIRFNAEVSSKFCNISPELWHCMNKLLRDRQKAYMRPGQQDSNEIAMMMIDSMEELEEVQDLFMHQYMVSIYCHECKKFCSEKTSEYPFFEVQPDLKSEQLPKFASWDKNPPIDGDLQSYLMKQNSYVDKDYRCPECGIQTERFKTTRLSRVPEILIVLSKIYQKRLATKYVSEMLLPLSGQPNKKLLYRAVAQVEHSGSMGGGHYWAYAWRAPCSFSIDPDTPNDSPSHKKWWNLNDSSVSRTDHELQPSEGTYMVFYNFMGIVDR